MTNGLGQTTNYTFDDRGRQTGVDYPTGTDVSVSYDAANRVSAVVDGSGTSTWTYDSANRVTQLSTPQGTINYTYDSANRRATMQQVGTGTTTYTFDAADRLVSLANPFSETTSWEYDAANRCTKETFANGVYSEFGFDARGRQTSVAHRNSSGVALSSESYVYDGAGNLSSKTVDSIVTSYTYDSIDQLLSESRPGYSGTYTYDGNGNRLTRTVNGVTEDYHVDDGDKLTSITQGLTTVKSFTYDAQGRTTGITTASGTTSFSYDYEDRVTGIAYPSTATNSFAYNAFDTRVSKSDSAGTATLMRDGVGVTAPVLSDGSSSFTPGVSQRSGSASTFRGMDRLGTFKVETNASQSVSATRQFDAFGNPTGATGTPTKPFGFAGAWGYQQDPDSSLMLLGHRYYDPSTGRFLTRDPAKDGRNWYGYCSNNGLRYLDPAGLFWAEVMRLIKSVVMPVIGAYRGLLMLIGVLRSILPFAITPGSPDRRAWPLQSGTGN